MQTNPSSRASSTSGSIGVVLCTCGNTLLADPEVRKVVSSVAGFVPGCSVSARSVVGRSAVGPGVPIFLHANLCSPAEQKALAKQIRQGKLDKLLFAGCSAAGREDLHRSIAQQAGLAPSSVLAVDLKTLTAGKGGSKEPKGAGRAKEAGARILKGLGTLALKPAFKTQRIPVEQRVLVIGAGPAGTRTALELRALGIATTLVERRESPSQETLQALAGGGAAPPRNPEVLSGSRLVGLSGHVGRFEARIATPKGNRTLAAGAVVVATGIPSPDSRAWPFSLAAAVPLEELATALRALPRRRTPRSVALLLDARFDEDKASMERALALAGELHDPEHLQVHIMCREARVASLPLETRYDEVREAGVDIIKYEGTPELIPAGEQGAIVSYRDAVLAEETALECDLVGVSNPGVQPAADPELAALTGLSVDLEGRLQDNNIHLFPESTNRKGIFVVGSCRGQFYLPQIQVEAQAAALAVAALLAPGFLEVELSSPVVDADKCVLCLTCVRTCPYGAMQIDHTTGAAASVPEACQRCGICAGECPAKAIELPAYSDAVLYSYAG